MSARIGFRWLRAGLCRHPECVVQSGGRCRVVDYPSLVGLLLHPTRGPMLFDTGHHARFLEATRPFPERLYRWVTPVVLDDVPLLQQLASQGIGAHDVRHVFVSHLHADHIAGLRDFPGAQLHAMRAEWDDMQRRGRIGGLRHGFLRALLPLDMAPRLRFAEDSARINLRGALGDGGGMQVGFDLLGDGSILGIPLPGHTAGQMGLAFETQSGRRVLLLADACWSLQALALDQPPTWLATGIFADRRAYRDTFHHLQALQHSDPDLLMLPSHCSASWEAIRHESL